MKTLSGALPAIALILTSYAAQGQDPIQYDPWEAWNFCGVGSTVEMSLGDGSYLRIKYTLVEKTADLITVNVENITKGPASPGGPPLDAPLPVQTWKITKPKGGPVGCGTCKQEHKIEIKNGTDTIKVFDQEMECACVETKTYDCDGRKATSSKRWFSRKIPGWLVKKQEGESTYTVTKSERVPNIIKIKGKILFLKGWGIDSSMGWAHLEGPSIEKLARSSSGKLVEVEGRWLPPTKSPKDLPPGDQGADSELWMHFEVTKLTFVDE